MCELVALTQCCKLVSFFLHLIHCDITDVLLRPLFDEVRLFDLCTNVSAYMISDVYDKLVNILHQASDVAVPRCRKN